MGNDSLNNNRILVYGGGFCGLMLCDMLIQNGILPVAIFDCDNNKNGVLWRNLIRIIQPNADYIENTIVIVCILDKGKTYYDIKRDLKMLGYKDVIHIFDFANNCDINNLFQNQKLILKKNHIKIAENCNKYETVEKLLYDSASKRVYSKIIELLQGKNVLVDALPFDEQYFSYEVFASMEEEVIIDVGAHVGQVMDNFISKVDGRFKEYHAFDIDSNYIMALNERRDQKDTDLQKKVFIHEYGLSDRNEIVNFTNYLNTNSVIDTWGDKRGYCSYLDSMSLAPSFIKIDVEGYEEKVIDGAKRHILKYQPLVACAMYHNEEELFRIPIKLHELLPKHRIVIRSYMNLNETICYAIPKERCLV